MICTRQITVVHHVIKIETYWNVNKNTMELKEIESILK